MNIALLTEKYTPDIGGLAISTERFARLLVSAGHNVRVFCPSVKGSASDTWTHVQGGLSIIRFAAHKRVDDTLLDWFELILEEHKRLPFDVLHAYFLTQAGFVAAYAGKYLDIPSVVSIRGNDIERAPFDPRKFSHIMYALQNASAATTNATVLQKKARAFFDREIILIPNGVDSEFFQPMGMNKALVETLGIPSDDPIIGFVGELREKKGLQALLLAYTQVIRTRPACLLIVGSVRAGEDKTLFEELKPSSSYARVVVTGYVSNRDLPSYYSVMDVLVHPSLRDGMPNAVLEAMACGKTVIATPAGGVIDVLHDGKNARLVSINDINSLSTIIQEVLSDKILQSRLGAAARQTVVDKFSVQNELDANLAVYCKLGLKT
jgi:glycosyltransferase involved in cell wall biosynthesis